MNILMLTNTYKPHIGGVAKSVDAFATEFRKRNHNVLIVAPEFPNQPEVEEDVIRIPAIQNFNGSDFSVVLPVPGLLTKQIDKFEPDIIHSHHPYLLGMTALRVARFRELPLVFTHHTLYEQYTHYVPADSVALKRFVVELATRYSNLANHVFAPSESIAELLQKRGVRTPVSVVPTGVRLEDFIGGNGWRFRDQMKIPGGAYVVGHLGRLAEEKNLEFLGRAVAQFMLENESVHFLLCGVGPLEKKLEQIFSAKGLQNRIHKTAVFNQTQLKDVYRAMDVFAFTSKSETQGMVLTEAMAAGVPVVALNASGTREVVRDSINGRLLDSSATTGEFAAALQWMMEQSASQKQRFRSQALKTAEKFSMTNTASAALSHYENLLATPHQIDDDHYHQWLRLRLLIKTEWEILEGLAGAAGAAFSNEKQPALS